MRSLTTAIFTLLLAAAAFGQGAWVSRSTGSPADLIAVYFTSATRGFVAGDNGYLASTNDGGKTWSKYPLNTNESINEIYFRNDNNGYLVAGRLMFITEDGGRSWKETRIYRAVDFRNGTPEFTSIRFADKNRGLVIGSIVNKRDEVIDSLLMRTDDGGGTWTRIPLPTKAEIFHLDLNGSSHGWIVGDKGLMLATTDGGLTWTTQATGISRALFGVDFRDDNDGFAVGGGGSIIRTENGGATWSRVITPYTDTLKRVYFSDDKNGWAVGLKGIVLRTADKGKSWIRQETPQNGDLYGLFMGKKFGFAVGEKGSVLASQR